MTTKAKAKSKIMEAVHETAVDLHRLGFIDQRKMRKYDALCLAPIPAYDSEQIRPQSTLTSGTHPCPKSVDQRFDRLSRHH